MAADPASGPKGATTPARVELGAQVAHAVHSQHAEQRTARLPSAAELPLQEVTASAPTPPLPTDAVAVPASHTLTKQFYRIGEVARIVGVQPHVLRYWESEFRTIRPEKSSTGQRVYSRRDVEKLLWVRELLKNQGFSIRGARKQLSSPELRQQPVPQPAPPFAAASPSAALPSLALSADSAAARGQLSGAHSAEVPPGALLQPGAGRVMRRALLQLRGDLLRLLAEWGAEDGRPDADRESTR